MAEYAITASTSGNYTYNLVVVLKSSGLSIVLPDGYDIADTIACVKASRSGLMYYSGSDRSPGNFGFVNGLDTNISGEINGITASVSGRRSSGGMIRSTGSGYGSTSTVFTIVAPSGYRPVGWLWGSGYDYRNFTTGFSEGSMWSHVLSTVVSSQYQEVAIAPVLVKVYTITFDANGGTGSPNSIEEIHGGTWTCPMETPTRAGFTCKGWSSSKTASSPEFVAGREYGPLESDLTVYAVWVPNQGTLVYNANGGSVSPQYKIVTVGETYGTLPVPSRSGCAFLGWFTAASGGTQVSATTKMGTGGIAIIYAHWETGSVTTSVTVTLNADGGTVSPSVVTATVNYPTLPNPTKTGHTFAGWFSTLYGDVQVQSGDALLEDEDHTIFAHWSRGNVTVTLDANGGSLSQTSKTVGYGLRLGKLPEPVLDGKKFAGWFTDRTGGTEATGATTITAAITLYAHWEAIPTFVWWEIKTF